jgi:monoamine oxidase
MNLTKRFNINILDTIAATNALYGTIFYFLNRYYNETQAWIDYKAIENIIIEQLAQIGDINYNQSNSYGQYFDNLSLYDWIEKYVPNGHQSDLGEYIDSAYKQEYGLDTQELNSLMFLMAISPETQPENGPLSIYGLSDQRYKIIGGNDQLPNRIGQYLTNQGITIQLDHNLTKIIKLNNKKYRLTFSNNYVSTFDHVILTLPLTTLKYVDYNQAQFDSLKKRLINEMKYGTNTKLNLQFSKRFWYDLSASGIIYTDLPFLNSWEASLSQPGDTGILVLFTGTEFYHII